MPYVSQGINWDWSKAENTLIDVENVNQLIPYKQVGHKNKT